MPGETAPTQNHSHNEQVDAATLDRFQRAANVLGNVTVEPIAQAGERFSTGHSVAKVTEGHTAIKVSGSFTGGDTAPFYSEVARLEAQDAAQQAADAPQQRAA